MCSLLVRLFELVVGETAYIKTACFHLWPKPGMLPNSKHPDPTQATAKPLIFFKSKSLSPTQADGDDSKQNPVGSTLHTMKISWREDDEFYQFSTKLGWFPMVILQKIKEFTAIRSLAWGVHSWNQPLVSMIEIPLTGTKVHCHAQRGARFDFETIW